MSKNEEYLDIFGSSSKPKNKKKVSKGLILVLTLLTLGVVGGVGAFAYNSYMTVSTTDIVVKADTLGQQKAKLTKLKKERLDLQRTLNKKKKEKEKNNDILHPIKEANLNRSIKDYESSIKKHDKAIADLEKKVFSNPNQKKIAEHERSRALNRRDGGKEFADKEWDRISKAEVDALNGADTSGDSGDSGKSGSDGEGGKSKAKSKTKEKKKGGKTSANWNGGKNQGVDTNKVERTYVEDSRRHKTDAIRFISNDPATGALMNSIMNTINSSVGGKYLVVYSSDGMFSFSNTIYKPMAQEDKRKVMELALKTIKESQLPTKVKNKVTNFIADQDNATADAIQALNSDTSWELSKGYAWFRPFSGGISTVFGFLAIVIFVFLSASIVFDLAYLTIGGFRTLLDNKDGKPNLITGEAWETAKEVDLSLQSGTYREYISVYFGKRVGIFIFTAIVLIYLISGQIYDISSWFLKVFEEVFQIRG